MNKIFLTSLFFCWPLIGQVLGDPSPVEDAIVLDEVVFQKGKDQLVVQRIEEPDFELDEDQSVGLQLAVQQSVSADHIPIETFVVSAIAYAERGTYFECWPVSRGKKDGVTGWSNMDWSVFQTHHQFTGEQKIFQIMFFYSKLSSEEADRRANENNSKESHPQVPEALTQLDKTGVHYLVTSLKEKNHENSLKFLEVIHAEYEQNSEDLKQKFIKIREDYEKRKIELRNESKSPKSKVFKVWRRALEKKQ